ncbi:MAG: serine/threonine protein phosphatase [Spirochaetes bacterium]|nr:serine/threonine protein phosphatase [Spirochaetota bacterium]
MYYIFGDIHGNLVKLRNIYTEIQPLINNDDTLVFLGDYIDRGKYSYEVIDFLIDISEKHSSIFLKGNHEDMFLKYQSGNNPENFLMNGGSETLKSYKKNTGSTSSIPFSHQYFFENLKLYHETEEFVAVHAGLNPKINSIEDQSGHDLIWIRDYFFRSGVRWKKTVIFGHTPCSILHGKLKEIYIDETANIIGIDTGACYGGLLTCLRWPDKKLFQG